ncbi:MAG: RIP metalloprotease RseP [Paracoccaceae bacterium]|nr:RIP metalloprotease RseP [Paracoccaceae bacterium]
MDLLATLQPVANLVTTVLSFLVVLTVVVFVHEFGHYIVGRWCGIRAQVFSVGFGRALYSRTDKHGTKWQVAVLPLGGFVKFVGDMDPASAGRAEDDSLTPEEHAASFHNAGLLARTLTVFAGPMANFLLSVVIFAAIVLPLEQGSSEPVIGEITEKAGAEVGFEAGDRVISIAGEPTEEFKDLVDILTKRDSEYLPATVERDGAEQQITVFFHQPAEVLSVTPGMPAEGAGMQRGDVIVEIDGEPIPTFRALQLATSVKSHGTEMEVVVDRAGERVAMSFVPDLIRREHPTTGEQVLLPTMGISSSVFGGIEPAKEPVPVHRALWIGVQETWRVISGTLSYIGDMIFEGADTSQLGGPIRIAEISGDAAEQGFSSVVWLIAVLSTSIGLINLFPIPILDGGHLLFYAIEFIRGRPVGETWMKVSTMIGLSLVLLLMVFATYNDIVRL